MHPVTFAVERSSLRREVSQQPIVSRDQHRLGDTMYRSAQHYVSVMTTLKSVHCSATWNIRITIPHSCPTISHFCTGSSRSFSVIIFVPSHYRPKTLQCHTEKCPPPPDGDATGSPVHSLICCMLSRNELSTALPAISCTPDASDLICSVLEVKLVVELVMGTVVILLYMVIFWLVSSRGVVRVALHDCQRLTAVWHRSLTGFVKIFEFEPIFHCFST